MAYDTNDSEWLKNQVVLILSPHPDDEVIGCGGLIRRVKKAGGKVYVLYFCVGNTQQYGSVSSIEKRTEEIKQVSDFFNIDGYHLAYSDDEHHLQLDTVPQKKLINLIEKGSEVAMDKINPTMVLLPFGQSYHQDHRAVFQAGITACRPRPGDIKSTPALVLEYEQPDVYWSSDKFEPNFFMDISEEIDDKISALGLYKSQVHPFPHPVSAENVRNIANSRGIHLCKKAVEAFKCHRFALL